MAPLTGKQRQNKFNHKSSSTLFFAIAFFLLQLKILTHVQCELNKVQITKRSNKNNRKFTSEISNSLRTKKLSSPRLVGVNATNNAGDIKKSVFQTMRC